MMRIQIIGGGAVGLLLASYFAEKNDYVTVVCHSHEQVEQLSKQLIRTDINGVNQVFTIHATMHINNEFDVTFVTVKSGQLQSILSRLPINQPIVFCQNGLAHFEDLNINEHIKAVFCAIQFGATKLSNTHVQHKGKGVMKFAAPVEYEEITKVLKRQSQDFPMEFSLNPELILFEKALLNTFINPLTAILQVKNGELLSNTYAFQILKEIYAEMLNAFGDECVSFEQVKELCEKTALNTSSMLADHMNGRQSEAPAIVGPIIQRAEKRGAKVPVVKSLYMQLLAIEEARGYVK